jgi:HEAT repeat protein
MRPDAGESWHLRNEKRGVRVSQQHDIAALIARLSAANIDTQEQAIEQLVEIGSPAVKLLIDAVNDGDAVVCANAVEALGQIKDERALGSLIIALQDPDDRVVMAAINALRRIGDPRAIQPLIAFLSQDDIQLHFNATHALGQLKHPQTVEALLEVIDSDDPNVRHGCAVALGRIGDRRAIPALTALLTDEESKIRYSAAYALGDLATIEDPDIINALEIMQRSDPDSNVRNAAQEALEKLRV